MCLIEVRRRQEVIFIFMTVMVSNTEEFHLLPVSEHGELYVPKMIGISMIWDKIKV